MDQFLLPLSDNIRHTSFSLTKNFSFNMYIPCATGQVMSRESRRHFRAYT
jgi:hypothetical protein